ncbi:MAG: hypothetical protein PHD76_13305 [Methylacidiphilales bacterium]|nr:hypothetical protein [Candidatus Methylacidiphilales bacterium]
MNALEWNPSLGPLVFSALVLGTGALFYFLFGKLASTHGVRQAWMLLLPKITLAALLLLALLDPAWKSREANGTPLKVIVLRDVSTSMDLKDDGSTSRADRAGKLIRQIESSAPGHAHFQVLPFDTVVHDAGHEPKAGQTSGTDLAAAVAALDDQGAFTGDDAAILVTDGGDETVEIPNLPSIPLAVVGVGTPADAWNDLGLDAVNAPTSIEEGAGFDIEAEIVARQGTLARSREALGALKVSLDEWRDKKWAEAQSKTVDARSLHATAAFHVKASGSGTQRYRVRLPELPGELTLDNNTRTLAVQVLKRSLHVLYFTQELGADYKYLRAELGADPGIIFTAMYRVSGDRFTVQGDRSGFEDLEGGFPVNEAVLKRYDCIILGSFPASLLGDPQIQALVRYVETGGALVLLGGDASFGCGGYAESRLAPLIPWSVVKNEPELTTGNFPVSLAASSSAVGFAAGLREALALAGGGSFDSVNQPGALRPGAVSVLEAQVGNRSQSAVALERYGKGQVLGIATNTLWRWAAGGQGLKSFYGKFWRQSLRGVTQKLEGGTLLGIRWNREHYRPGEAANVEVRLQGASDSGAVRLAGSVEGPDGNREVAFAPVAGQAGFYTAKPVFAQRGGYTFRIAAYAGGQVVENYERFLDVSPLVEEGANPELKEAYLRDLAKRAHGIYASENETAQVAVFLKEKMALHEPAQAFALADVWNVFLILVLVILVAEWLLRRRLNLI